MAAYLAQAGVSTLDYVETLERQRCAAQDNAARVATPGGGWPAFWRSLGVDVVAAQRTSRAPYLEEKAKTNKSPDFEIESRAETDWQEIASVVAEGGFRTCGEGGPDALKGFAVKAQCERWPGEPVHEVAKIIVCNREWCARCGVNAEPGVKGSMAHQRRIARWLPKMMQLEKAGYLTYTFPLELRSALRDPAELSYLSIALKRSLVRLGFKRGLRRWHFFGDPPADGSFPIYHPHLNVGLDAGYIDPALLEAIKLSFARILKRRYGYAGNPVAEYHFRTGPAELYHMVRYITRATFKNALWDEQLSLALQGFRNQASWGKWDGESVWEPEPEDLAPSLEAQAVTAGQCPGEHSRPVKLDWKPRCAHCGCAMHVGLCLCGCSAPWLSARVISATRLHTWHDLGAGYYMAAGPPKRGSP